MKRLYLTIFLFQILGCVFAQGKEEVLTIGWPLEYKWKIIRQTEDSNSKEVIIIPGNETPNTTKVLGVMKAYPNHPSLTVAAMIEKYKHAIDSGSVMTVIEQSEIAAEPWILFTVETPATVKYPIPESDLYYVRQGQFALFESFVGLRKSSFDPSELDKWIKIMKSATTKFE